MPSSHTNKTRLVLTMGDPAGIGPEIIMRSLANLSKERFAAFTVVGDGPVLMEAADRFFKGGEFEVVDPGGKLSGCVPGKPTQEGARKALASIDEAVRILKRLDTPLKALVTAPVSKEMIAGVKPGFIGHTEHLMEAFSSARVTMVLTGEHFSVVPVTRHIPLKEVANSLSGTDILETIAQVVEGRMTISGKKDPRIGVAALNPHGGEGGKIGREEIDVISPAIEEARAMYPLIEGPVPADIVFYKAMRKYYDIVIAMYHDQGLGPFKMVDFSSGVNMTLGLGCVRTSPDHGTAFDIAGKGMASSGSMEKAILAAARAASPTYFGISR